MQHLAVLGAGELGIGIAQIAMARGFRVSLFDPDSSVLAAAGERIEAGLITFARGDMVDEAALTAAIEALTITGSLASLSDADLVVDASGPESSKATLLAELGALLAAETIIAVSTGTGSITALAAATPHSERVVGMHFFIPVQTMELVEIIPGLRTPGWVTERAAELARALGKIPVESRNRPGFIVGRVTLPFASEAIEILDDGVATAGSIDALVEALGFRIGPFAYLDRVGLDVYHASCRAMYEATFGEPRYRPSVLVAEMLEAGLRGRESGEGFYDYPTE